ncbi:hypothetical protein DFS34DRAFT_583593 [Phlyctochytrium arcticum]|nr:hypothetical protein DFS34DRAFT_583593 [Phlyctochytrium arcticum]
MDLDEDSEEEEEEEEENVVKRKPRTAQKTDPKTYPPIHSIPAMFDDMIQNLPSSAKVAQHLLGRPLRVATMCSGTESPLLALRMISRAIEKVHGLPLDIEHVFSCEIEPFKQAYIERNFSPPILFRNVCELGNPSATTAYGALVPVPSVPVDLLIAGTSCVDYSNLNNKKKTIHGGGESGKTFWGMLDWVKRQGPKLVILENVCSADWKSMTREFSKIGYVVTHARFDTKEYYIPHTRTRGYLFASKDGSCTLPDQWQDLVRSMRRPASSPLEAFMLEPDDPRVHRARQEYAKTRDDGRAARSDWERCESRHERERIEQGLGSKRPFSRWEPNSICRFPDYAWNDWGARQSTRVLDSIDILYLKLAASTGIDAESKTLVWELSQNVDRISLTVRPGICPCLTPRVIPFVTNRGGPITGRESLGLQGIPVDELLLTRETERNLHDLAGNAMTTTVVGSAMMAALVVALNTLDKGTGIRPLRIEQNCYENIKGDEHCKTSTLSLGSFDHLPPAELLHLAQRTSRLCFCEGRGNISSHPIQKCTQCAATSCTKCGIRPEHEYTLLDSSDRLPPAEFESRLIAALPMRLKIRGFEEDELERVKALNGPVDKKDWNLWRDAVVEGLKYEFRFRRVKRQDHWVVHYDTPSARLVLVLDPQDPRVLLFADPPPTEPVNSRLRTLLSVPVARMPINPTGGLLLEGDWEVNLPVEKTFSVTMTGQGELVDSWEAKIGLQGRFDGLKWWSQLDISLPDAHAKSVLDTDISGVFTLSAKCGTPMQALHKRSDDGLFLMFDPDPCGGVSDDRFCFSWDCGRYPYGQDRLKIATVDPTWRPNSHVGPQNVQCHVRGNWVAYTPVRVSLDELDEDMGTVGVPGGPLRLDCGPGTCTAATAILSCVVPLSTHAEPIWPLDEWQQIDGIHHRPTFEQLAWITERVKSIDALKEWMGVDGAMGDCEGCAPTPPALIWTLTKHHSVTAAENPEMAAPYEQKLKARPAAFVAQLRREDGKGFIRLGVNVASVVHKAMSRLKGAKVQWRLTTTTTTSEAEVMDAPGEMTVTSNKGDELYAQPPSFGTFKLRPEQRRSLGWMVSQETLAPTFGEEEVVEASLDPLNWRVEARAHRDVIVRGGVLADQVGYGKTALVLGLIDHMKNTRTSDETPLVKGRIPIKATLIIVPAHLLAQWPAEIAKFTGSAFNVLTLVHIGSLNKVSIQEIMDADIIVVGRSMVNCDGYWTNLTAVAGSESLPDSHGRYFEIRYKEVLEQLKERVRELVDGRVDQVLEAIREGGKRRKGKSRDLKDPWKLKSKEVQADWTNMRCPPLELFHFDRIVVDEYTFVKERDYTCIRHLIANARWVLSGTTPTKEFASVKTIASFLGIHLGVDDPLDSGEELAKRRLNERTAAEKFEAFKDVYSTAWYARRRAVAQRFLDMFVRRNVAGLTEIPVTETFVDVVLPPAEKALYFELKHYLVGVEGSVKRVRKGEGDREYRLGLALEQMKSQEQALLIRVSHFEVDGTATEACERIVKERKRQLEACKNTFLEAVEHAKDLYLKIMARGGYSDKEDCPLRRWWDLVGNAEDSEAGELVLGVVGSVGSLDSRNVKSKIHDQKKKKKRRHDSDSDSDSEEENTKGSGNSSVTDQKWQLREHTHHLRRLQKELTNRIRSLRYIQTVRSIQLLQSTTVTCPGCQATFQLPTQYDQVCFLSCCGHMGCVECVRAQAERERCVDVTCGVSCRASFVVDPATLGSDVTTTLTTTERNSLRLGEKMRVLTDLIQHRIPDQDRILVFIQFTELRSVVSAALADAGIPFIKIEGSAHKMSSAIDKFQNDSSGGDAARVLVLNAANEEASGANLTGANHVIFVSPLWMAESERRAMEVQAIGRVRRYGQTKSVHVWRLRAVGTIDEEVYDLTCL